MDLIGPSPIRVVMVHIHPSIGLKYSPLLWYSGNLPHFRRGHALNKLKRKSHTHVSLLWVYLTNLKSLYPSCGLYLFSSELNRQNKGNTKLNLLNRALGHYEPEQLQCAVCLGIDYTSVLNSIEGM